MEKPENGGPQQKGRADSHFHMSPEYERHSSSQKTIGHVTNESVVNAAREKFNDAEEINVLDIACGPGNLTIELKKDLTAALPKNKKINVVGLDYTEENVRKMVENPEGSVEGIVGSFYEMPVKSGSQDIITSNEGLHWQPPREISEIIYSQLPPDEKGAYERWALKNFKKSIKNIHTSLKEGGMAVLQFGHEGQLQKLWDLLRDTFDEEKFRQYKSGINMPLFYPTLDEIKTSFKEAGFSEENIEINAFNQYLTEDTPKSIVQFYEAFSRPNFKQVFGSDEITDAFYRRMEEKLSGMDISEFRKDQWHRTIVKARK